jgi:superfamily II DNA or RNA helicase
VATLTLTDDESALRDVVGAQVLLGGRELAGKGAVKPKRTAMPAGRLAGSVLDAGHRHDVQVQLTTEPDGRIAPLSGWCTCGRAVPCRHAVALVLSTGTRAAAAPALPARRTGPTPSERSADRPDPHPWEAALGAALTPADQPRPDRPGSAAHLVPTGSGLALQFDPGPAPLHRIAVRLVSRGRSGGWIRSQVTWSSLAYPEYYLRHVPRDQVRLLKELNGLPADGPRNYRDAVIWLDSIASRRVWDLLLEAQDSGLPLVGTGPAATPVRIHRETAAYRVDVSRRQGRLEVRPVLEVEGSPLVSHRTVGEPPHGVCWKQPGGGLHLARLAAAPPALLTRLAGDEAVRIPEQDEGRFLAEYYPRLLEQVDVVSLDGSVDLPRPAPPALELTVASLGGHRIQLRWGWRYALGDHRRHEPLVAPSSLVPRHRDLAAEAGIVGRVTAVLSAGSDLTGAAGPVDGDELDGVATARFLTEIVPRLRELPDLDVRLELDGERDYRQVDAAPVIEFTAPPSDGPTGPGANDWFDLAVSVRVDGRQVPFEPLFVALAQEQEHLLLDDGMWFSLDRPEFAALARLIAESRELLDAPAETLRIGRYHAGIWEDVESIGSIKGQVESWREAVRALSEVTELPRHEPPAGLDAELRPYQATGFDWLATLYDLGLGGILADDMGLGKTLQTLALVLRARELGQADRPFLVVAPTSVVATWAAEAARFTPQLDVRTVGQTQARRGCDLAEAVAGAHLVVTSYTLFRLEFEQYQRLDWAGLVLDEAQQVKNAQSAGFRCARELSAPFKLAITGTPMENNLMELWALLSITAPGLFARADRFGEYYRAPIERRQDADRLAQLRRRIRPLLLRRTKGEVAADLPARQEQVIELELAPRHRAVYQRYLQRERQKVLGLLGDLNRNRFEILRSLTLLRQASLDVGLIDPAHAGVPSTKLTSVVEQLQNIVAEGHRVLVFSQFTRFLGKAREQLEQAGIDCCYLDGKTRNRAGVIAGFRQGEQPVFLISLKAGGTGLTLTEADYVVLLDPWWNPATEAQAVDRVHRIGQTRNVMVYRLIAKDTIEEKVMALKARKAALASSVLDGDAFAGAALTAEDIRELMR